MYFCSLYFGFENLILVLKSYRDGETWAPGDILSDSVFSLNLSSAGKGLFIAGMAKNIHQRCTFLRAGG